MEWSCICCLSSLASKNKKSWGILMIVKANFKVPSPGQSSNLKQPRYGKGSPPSDQVCYCNLKKKKWGKDVIKGTYRNLGNLGQELAVVQSSLIKVPYMLLLGENSHFTGLICACPTSCFCNTLFGYVTVESNSRLYPFNQWSEIS